MATTAAAGSLFDVPTLVSQLMTVANQPITALQAKVANDQSQISAWGTISGLISTFQTSVQGLNTSLQANTATPSDASVFSASATGTAVPGNYSLSVTNIAQAQSLVAAGQTSGTTAIGSAATTVSFTVGATTNSVSITAGATLQDISAAINAANLGISATIVNDGSATPYRLALSSNSTGVSNRINSITIQAGGDAAINNLLAYQPTANAPTTITMTQTVPALDANFSVNGIAITGASNTVSNAIQGVTLTLNKATTTPATLKIAHDTTAASTAVSSFVSAYNALSSQLASAHTYNNHGGGGRCFGG